MTISIIFLALSANQGAAGLIRFRKHLSCEGSQLLVCVLFLYKPRGFYSRMSKSHFNRQSCLGGKEVKESRYEPHTHCRP